MDLETRKEAVQKILVSVPDYIQKVMCDTDQKTPPFKCAVSSCQNFFLCFEERDSYTYKFHNFPLCKNLQQIWKKQCGLPQNADISRLKVCSDHFSLDDYIRNYREEFLNPSFKRKLNPDAVPRNKIQTSGNLEAVSDGLSRFDEIKEAMDEREILSNKCEALLKTKCDLVKKIVICDKKTHAKLGEIDKIRDRIEKDRTKFKSNFKNKNDVVRKIFSVAQINLLLGKEKVFWSDDDLAKAFILRHIGSKECYIYLKNTLNMPLPALSSVQKWAASYSSSSE